MKEKLLKYIVCPDCKKKLELTEPIYENNEIKEGKLICICGRTYNIINYIPRFVDTDKYAGNFSFQWNMARRYIEIYNKLNYFTAENFFQSTGIKLKNFEGKVVLDAGAGLGGFLKLISENVDGGGEYIGVDLSSGLDIALEQIGFKKNVHLIQADIMKLPFYQETFDYIYSIGVLHHAPNCEKAFKSLIPFLKKNGEIGIWLYQKSDSRLTEFVNIFYRKLTTIMPKRLLYVLCWFTAPFYYFKKIPHVQTIMHLILPGFLFHFFPKVSESTGTYLKEQVISTFDWYSAQYQSKHTYAEVFEWFSQSGLIEIKILPRPVSLNGKK